MEQKTEEEPAGVPVERTAEPEIPLLPEEQPVPLERPAEGPAHEWIQQETDSRLRER